MGCGGTLQHFSMDGIAVLLHRAAQGIVDTAREMAIPYRYLKNVEIWIAWSRKMYCILRPVFEGS